MAAKAGKIQEDPHGGVVWFRWRNWGWERFYQLSSSFL